MTPGMLKEQKVSDEGNRDLCDLGLHFLNELRSRRFGWESIEGSADFGDDLGGRNGVVVDRQNRSNLHGIRGKGHGNQIVGGGSRFVRPVPVGGRRDTGEEQEQ